VQITSDHFTLITDANEKEGRHILDQFERMRWVFGKFFPNLNPEAAIPIAVVAVKNGKGFEALLPPDRMGKGQLQLAGMFMRSFDKNYILLRLGTNADHPYATVYHEYTHQQIAAGHIFLPIWLNEGMAEFMQNTEFRDKDVVVGEASADNLLYLRQNSLIPLPVLFKVDASSPYYHEEQKGSVFYAESWALTHYLMIKDHETHNPRIGMYAHLVGNGADPVTAAQEAFGDLRQLEIALHAYIDHGEYKALALPSAAAPIDESNFKARPLSPADAEAAQADVMAYDQRTDDAHSLADTVLKEDPNNIQAHETLGFLESRAGKLEEARKWYGEAIKLGSQNFLDYYYCATFAMGSDNDEAEADFRAAIKLNPNFAPPYDRLAQLLARQRDHLDEAHMLNVQAIQLEPDNIAFRVNAAYVLDEMSRSKDAMNVMKGAAQAARNQRDTAEIQSAIQRLEQNQQRRTEMIEAEQQQAATAATSQTVTVNQSVVDIVPKRPTLPADGPRLTASGVIHDVKCSYPSVIEFSVAGQDGKKVALYNNDFSKIELSAAANVKVAETVYPCSDFDGKTVRAQYVKGQSADGYGQIVAVELMK
jgi:tetratricopeptide (TPR) repeat protein